MKAEDKKIVIASITMIVLLGFFSYLRWSDFKISDAHFSLSFENNNIETPSMEDLLPEDLLQEENEKIDPQEKEYDTIIIDEEIVFQNPSEWEAIEIDEELQDEKIKFLFASKSESLFRPSSVAVLNVESSEIEEAIEIMKEKIEIDGLVMSLKEKEEEENYLLLDFKNTHGETVSYTKKKALFRNETFYIFSVTVFEEKWPLKKDLVNYLLSQVSISD